MRGVYFFPFPTLRALDNLVFAMIGDENAIGGADSSGVGGMGVKSNHSLSSRSAESDEIEREKLGADRQFSWDHATVGHGGML